MSDYKLRNIKTSQAILEKQKIRLRDEYAKYPTKDRKEEQKRETTIAAIDRTIETLSDVHDFLIFIHTYGLEL